MKARIKFRKYGSLRFIGHLDVMRFFQKVMRRADIPIAFSGGYSPHMIMSFAQPLGVGVTSDGEYFDIEITKPISSENAVAQLNAVMVEGIEVISFREISSDKKASGMTIVAAADYKVTFPETFRHAEEIRVLPESWKGKVEAFMAQPEIVVLSRPSEISLSHIVVNFLVPSSFVKSTLTLVPSTVKGWPPACQIMEVTKPGSPESCMM